MKLEMWKTDQVIPYENNPRNNEEAVEPVARSIERFGFQQPIVVDRRGVIIVGHTRLKAAKRLGLTEVPVVVANDLSEELAKAYRLADNKTGELAVWDLPALNLELKELDFDFHIDMSDFGFTFDEEKEESQPEKTEPEPEITAVYQVVIECDSENHQKEIFEEMTNKGLKCKLLYL